MKEDGQPERTLPYDVEQEFLWRPENTSSVASLNGSRGEGAASTLPSDMVFTDYSLFSVVSYCVLFVVAAVGNLSVFTILMRGRHRKSRVKRFILHLSIADLIVTFVMLPLETVWHVTVAWLAGDILCRLLMFFRAFGFYLSSFLLVTISLDRYFAILRPLNLSDADQRSKLMLILAWLFSIIASVPQSVIFHVEQHPDYPWFSQCVTFNFFPTPVHELVYNLFNLITVYAFPLFIIVVSYARILWEMTKKTRESREEMKPETFSPANERMRRSGVGRIQRARVRTLKMTIMIVLVFILCWTPYYTISVWWWFDKASARQVDPMVQRGLFLFAVSNSCMNPIVYGMFTINFKRDCGWWKCWVTKSTSTVRINGLTTAVSECTPQHSSTGRMTLSNGLSANSRSGGREPGRRTTFNMVQMNDGGQFLKPHNGQRPSDSDRSEELTFL